MNGNLLNIEIRVEEDVVLTRQRARQIASVLNLSVNEQTAFATAVSELARNAFRYAGGGRAEVFLRVEDQRPILGVTVQDKGPGIPHLMTILDGQYRSQTGMGLGIIGSKRLSDEFDIQTMPGKGTTVTIKKWLPKRSPPITTQLYATIANELSQRTPRSALEEVQQQNQELLQALEDLRMRQEEVERLNAELAETNRGVVALYAELDEKAESLRKASEYKTRFLSDMTHELRTPLNAMISLSRLLLDRTDGDLTPEQEKQVRFIQKSAQSLGEMVNDLLDLARIEAGKTDLHITEFAVSDLLTALRGMFRPLVGEGAVMLRVDEPFGFNMVRSDERKLSQVLRNLVSNAIKFTERGEVRVRATAAADGTAMFTVSDTGIGISAENLSVIFQDFSQIDGPVQRRVRGTGLGLPLTRKLARLLGGDVTVSSEPDVGSTFTVVIPIHLSKSDLPGAGHRQDQAVSEGSQSA
jgi:signal transduction histidine kinase